MLIDTLKLVMRHHMNFNTEMNAHSADVPHIWWIKYPGSSQSAYSVIKQPYYDLLIIYYVNNLLINPKSYRLVDVCKADEK